MPLPNAPFSLDPARDDAQRRGLRIGAVAVLVLSVATIFHGLYRWPWDVDEVATLQEMGLYRTDEASSLGAGAQLSRLPRLIPLWYLPQARILAVLPITEGNTRLLSATCAVLTVLSSYVLGARRHGVAFGACLALMIGGNPLFLALAQQNRFYPMATLTLALAAGSIFRERDGRKFDAGILLVTATAMLAVLSHTLTVAAFGLAALAGSVSYRFGWVSRRVLFHSLVAAGVAAAFYLGYVRPRAAGWNEALPPRTTLTVVISFVSEVGIPTFALAVVGILAPSLRPRDEEFHFWALLTVLCLGFVAVGPRLVWFNYRYGLFFALPLCVMAARGVQSVGQRLGKGLPAWSWYACVVVLLAPKILSHYVDGSRRDWRKAAEVITAQAKPGDPLYCNWRELSYYLPGASIKNWNPGTDFPETTCYVALGGNAWEFPPPLKRHILEVVARVGKRRFDEQTNMVTVFRLSPRRDRSPTDPTP